MHQAIALLLVVAQAASVPVVAREPANVTIDAKVGADAWVPVCRTPCVLRVESGGVVRATFEKTTTEYEIRKNGDATVDLPLREAQERANHRKQNRTAGIVGTAIGGALTATSLGLFVAALSSVHFYWDSCEAIHGSDAYAVQNCGATRQRESEAANTYGALAVGTLITGGVLLAAGIVGMARAGRPLTLKKVLVSF